MNMPAGQADANEFHSLVDNDMNFGVFSAPRRSYCLIFQTGTCTLMHFAKSRVNFKQGCILCVGIDDF